jgi:FkbM family methyltransferase
MRLLKGPSLPSSQREANLIGLNELASLDRWALERRSRALAQTAFLGDQVTLCRVLGRYKLYVPTTDIGFGAHVMMDGVWEPWLTVFMARRIKPGMYVVDAGANHGYYTMLFADLVGDRGKVAAVEANPHTMAFLRNTIHVNGFDDRVLAIEKALGSSDDQIVTFHTPRGEPKNARVVLDTEAELLDTVQVQGARLDSMLAHWPKVEFIKLDVEGAEEAALAGAAGLIDRYQPELLIEFNSHRCADPNGLLDWLETTYGHQAQYIDYESRAVRISRSELLNPANREDWLLSFRKI